VERECSEIQETLAEVAGDLDSLDAPLRRHVESCPACRVAADQERGLDQVLFMAVPPEDPDVVETVMASLGPARFRRRVVAFVPVAASLVIALIGVGLLGGVPGGSLLAELPTVSSQAWLAIAGAFADWGVAMAAAADAAKLTLAPAVQLIALVVGLAGLVAVVTATRRWKPVAPWQRGDS
jgi:hypothetical protein